MANRLILILLILTAAVGIGAAVVVKRTETLKETPSSFPLSGEETATTIPIPSLTREGEGGFIEPVSDFKSRITKKLFGTHVTPQDSPVQPEKFTGYHTGVDAEYGDVTTDVPVHAIADGTVLLARTASGYGGVIAIQHSINNQSVVGIYGHVDPGRLPKVGQKVEAGEEIGFLGKAFSSQTDGERRHLHFGLAPGTAATLAGYVSGKDALSSWLDPLTIF